MKNTVAFVTNQYSCDRIIASAKEVAQINDSQLVVVGIMDNEYEINPEAVDYLFNTSKENHASMQLIFREDKLAVMHEVIGAYECGYVVSGMPSSNKSILYDLWKDFPDKKFYTIDSHGEITEVANSKVMTR